jgi:hypothetical protein
MEVEKPHPPLPFPSSPGPELEFRVTSGEICGSLLCSGLFSLGFSRGLLQNGQAQVGQSLAYRVLHRDQGAARKSKEGASRGGVLCLPWPLWDPGPGLGKREIREVCHQCSSPSFHTLRHSLAHPSLPPSATKCQHISLYVPFPCLSSPNLHSQISRSCSLENFSSRSFLPMKSIPFPEALVFSMPSSSGELGYLV